MPRSGTLERPTLGTSSDLFVFDPDHDPDVLYESCDAKICAIYIAHNEPRDRDRERNADARKKAIADSYLEPSRSTYDLGLDHTDNVSDSMTIFTISYVSSAIATSMLCHGTMPHVCL